MQQFPSIANYKTFSNQSCIAFDKLDGSNVRFEWSKKRGWHKAGTRKRMLDETHPHMGQAPAIFLNKYGESLERIFRDNNEYNKRDSFTVFGEFFGSNSFAGVHELDDDFDVVLFDIWIYRVGMIGPRELIDNFGHLHIPDVIYEGNLDVKFLKSVRRNDYNLREGVICKWGKTGKWKKDIRMCKIKTQQYIDRVKALYGTGKHVDSAGDFHDINDDVFK